MAHLKSEFKRRLIDVRDHINFLICADYDDDVSTSYLELHHFFKLFSYMWCKSPKELIKF